jgi:phosphoglycerate dehydrogenase-like enzyme
MTSVLILLAMPENVRMAYYNRIRAKFPELDVNVVDHHTKVGPYIGAANVLLTFCPMMADHVVRDAPNLEWIQALGSGVDNIADLPSLRPDVLVTTARGVQGIPVSEATIALMLALARSLPRAVRNQDRHHWERWPARLLHGKTAGIFGIGQIAEVLAPKLKALGMNVIGVSSAKRSAAGIDRMHHRDELVAVVRELDFFVLLTPYSAETKGIVDARVLAAMKPASFLVNVARGGVMDEAALIEALKLGKIAGAALDVFAEEPLPESHPFWSMPNVIVTPHLAGFNDAYVDHVMPIVEANLRKFVAGDRAGMINVWRPGRDMAA